MASGTTSDGLGILAALSPLLVTRMDGAEVCGVVATALLSLLVICMAAGGKSEVVAVAAGVLLLLLLAAGAPVGSPPTDGGSLGG